MVSAKKKKEENLVQGKTRPFKFPKTVIDVECCDSDDKGSSLWKDLGSMVSYMHHSISLITRPVFGNTCF